MKIRFTRNFALLVLAGFFCLAAGMTQIAVSAIPDNGNAIVLATTAAGPRAIEDTTKTAVERDYANAWQSMSDTLGSGDATPLDHFWTGVALDKLLQLAKDEQRANLRVRYSNHLHKLQAIFYPTDGAALLLHDSVEGTLEILDGGKVVASEPFSQKYVVLMTPGQDRWFVRVFEPVPSF